MDFEQFSGNKVLSEFPSTISLLSIYEESAKETKQPRSNGHLSLSWGYNVDTADDSIEEQSIRASETSVGLIAQGNKKTSHLSGTETMQLSGTETTHLSGTDKTSDPRDAVKDQYGNLTRFKIGPESEEAQVLISYEDASVQPPTVKNTTIKRGDREVIDFVREQDPADPNSPFIYTEARNGTRGDLLYGSFDVASDGRLTLYFDFDKKRPAITFNPKTGYEEYP